MEYLGLEIFKRVVSSNDLKDKVLIRNLRIFLGLI